MGKASLHDAPAELVEQVTKMVEDGYNISEILTNWEVSQSLELLLQKPPTRYYLQNFMKIHEINVPKATTEVTSVRLWMLDQGLKVGFKLSIITQAFGVSKQYAHLLKSKIDKH